MSECFQFRSFPESQCAEHLTPREALFKTHFEWAGKVARSLQRHLPPSFDIADLQQEARIALWRKTAQYDPSGKHDGVPFQGFAYLAVRGAVLMSVRRRAYRDATAKQLHDTHFDARPRPDQAAEQVAVTDTDDRRQDWQLRWLHSALCQLPPEQREIVCGVYFEGADPDELAARMGLTAREFSSYKRAAVKQLEKMRPSEPAFSTAVLGPRQLQTPTCRPLRPPLELFHR